jgi:ribosome-binding protein aMBF1 (putative translation factor)
MPREIAVHVPWLVMHHIVMMWQMPNLSRNRQDPVLVALGAAIKRTRLEKEISQERLALLAEVDRSYVGRVERGDNNVAILTLMRIAKALDISIAELMREAKL